MRPEDVQAWFRVLRDIASYGLGAMLLYYEFVALESPNTVAVGVGVAAMALPPVLRINQKDKDNGSS